MLTGFVQLRFHCSCFARNENLIVIGWRFLNSSLSVILFYVIFLQGSQIIVRFEISFSNMDELSSSINIFSKNRGGL